MVGGGQEDRPGPLALVSPGSRRNGQKFPGPCRKVDGVEKKADLCSPVGNRRFCRDNPGQPFRHPGHGPFAGFFWPVRSKIAKDGPERAAGWVHHGREPLALATGKPGGRERMGKKGFLGFLMVLVPAAGTAGAVQGPAITVMQRGKTVYSGYGNVAPAAHTLENLSVMIMKDGNMVGSLSAFTFPGNPVSLKQRSTASRIALTLIPLPGKWIQVVGRAAGASTSTRIHLERGRPAMVHLGPYALEIVRAGV